MSKTEYKYTREFYNTDIKKGIYKVKGSNGRVIKTVKLETETLYGIKEYDKGIDSEQRTIERHHELSMNGLTKDGKEVSEFDRRLGDSTFNPECYRQKELLSSAVNSLDDLLDEAVGYVGVDGIFALELRYSYDYKLIEIASVLGRNSAQSVDRFLESSMAKLKEFLVMKGFFNKYVDLSIRTAIRAKYQNI